MTDKILQIDVVEDIFINNITTNLLLLKIAKEAGYNKVNLTMIGLPVGFDTPYPEPVAIDDIITEQNSFLKKIME